MTVKTLSQLTAEYNELAAAHGEPTVKRFASKEACQKRLDALRRKTGKPAAKAGTSAKTAAKANTSTKSAKDFPSAVKAVEAVSSVMVGTANKKAVVQLGDRQFRVCCLMTVRKNGWGDRVVARV